ncbi:MAG: phosphoribosylformylglycinamidine synthase subunit PurQ [Pseudomonadota bacterium]|nr:phosphoribosylformylglycinamidine synthase subunit PurQ [Pseudomonadota bacterium]MEC8094115.1 phosphoribosylformylglycinamidine synthase subunit PurQ [Pseudomonadota bacterium]
MRAAVIVFPGSNCDRDVTVCLKAAGAQVDMVWHGDTHLPACDLIVLPGGFSYGDYLRCGSMAANSPIMREVVARSGTGTAVLGICNGFQVLTECGLLPGILMRNRELNFVCRNTRLNVSRTDTPFTHLYAEAEEISIPVAHNEGNYFADDETLKRLQGENRIVFTYAEGDNPNGACLDIAGITDATGRVLGMMPHPERRAETPLGGEDGRRIFDSAMEMLA